MPYIDTTVTEGNLLNDLLALFGTQGWTKERYFKRTAFNAGMINPVKPPQAKDTYAVTIAEHMILNHPSSDLMYGFAVIGDLNLTYGAIPTSSRPKASKITSTDTEIENYRSNDGFAAFAEWATNKWPPFKQKHTLYVYMIEKVHDEFIENQDSCIAWAGDLKQAALDLDVIETGYRVVQGSEKLQVYELKDSKRSPVAEMSFRIPVLDTSNSEFGIDAATSLSNWHPDSKIDVRGLLDNEKAMLILEADASASYENNAVPTIPLYIGKFDSLDPVKDKYNFCLMAGSAFPTNSPTLDYDSPTPMKQVIQPLLQTYPSNPSNGVDNVMVYRNRKGAYYQRHVLFVETAPNLMDPARTHNGKDYVKAWQQAESPVSKYQFNPSQYDDKVKTSYAYLSHSEDGLRGKLKDVVVANPISIIDYTTLKHRESTCPTVYSEYTAFNTGAVSPLSKIPGTPFHSLAIGILTKSAAQATPL